MSDAKIERELSKLNKIELMSELFKRKNFDFIVKGKDEDGNNVCHEKQRQALEILTSNTYEEFLYGGAAGGAKIVANDGVVLTPHGWKKGKDLKVGTLINNPDGNIQRIIAIKPEIYVDQWTVYFSDGTHTDVGKEHLWQAWKSRKGRKIGNKVVFGEKSAEVIQTDELKSWLDRGYTPQIPVCEPQKFNRTTREKNIIPPYLLGVLLGDGCLTGKQISISSGKDDIQHYVDNIGELNFSLGKDSINFKGETNSWLKEKVKLHGLEGRKSIDKFIPEYYKWSNVDSRFALLQGLMDTDGTVDKSKNSCSYTTISKQLADDVAFVVRSLGGTVTISKNKAGYKDKEGNYIRCNDAYRLYIRMRDRKKMFRLKRKQIDALGKNSIYKRVVDVKITGKIRGRCITVSNPNGLYITNDFIVTHNSWTGCAWIMFMAICYPKTKYFIARNELKDILDSVLVTFNKVARAYGFDGFKFNAQKNFIQFDNGSHINFIELKYKPSDPMFEDVGSTEYTCGWIEEVGETHVTGAAVISSRVGRHYNKRDEHGNIRKTAIKGIVLYTCNPKLNWAKTEFYDKDKAGTLEKEKAYLQCLITENPFIEKDYVDKLRRMASKDKSLYERLFKGNWDYEDNPNQLTDQEMIEQVFDNNHAPDGVKYITADIATIGADLAVICVWSGWKLIEMITFDKSKTTEISMSIFILRRRHQIPKIRCIVDGDGVGAGVADQVGAIGFKNNGRPVKESGDMPNYRNIQVQCLYHLADRVNDGSLWICADISEKQKQEIKQELAQIISVISDYGKLDLKRKSQIKEDIGRSPDYRDALLMRVYFDLKKTKRKFVGAKPRTR